MNIKRLAAACIGVAFVLLSVFFISTGSEKKQNRVLSSMLTEKTTIEGNQIITEYVDKNGKPAIAADLGYAVKIVTKADEEETEAYFDEEKKPITISAGYHAILRKYDDSEKIIRIAFLNENGNPVLSSTGYAIEHRVYSDDGMILSVRYYDTEEKPIRTASYGYGKDQEYDDAGRVTRITYVDESGKPLKTRMEYASVTRTWYDNGKLKDEYYYDKDGNATSLSSGAYGVHRDYNDDDQSTILTFLNEKGEPIVTNAGYAKIIRSRYANNTEYTEMYYDMDGNPVALAEGQYGVMKGNGGNKYLDKNGHVIFNLKNYLHNSSKIVVLFSIVIIIISALVEKKWNILLLAIYLAVIGYLTLMFRKSSEFNTFPEVLWSYKHFFINDGARSEILKNIWLFIPLGAILYQLYPKKTILLVPFVLSILIEGIQYYTGMGFCELDDVISNSLGGIAGFFAGALTTSIKERINKGKHIYSA